MLVSRNYDPQAKPSLPCNRGLIVKTMVQKTRTLALLCARCFPYTYFHAFHYPAFTCFHISIYLPCRIVSLAATVQLDREVLQQLLLSQYRMLMISVLSLLCRSTEPLYSKTLYRYCFITNPTLQNHAYVIGDTYVLIVTMLLSPPHLMVYLWQAQHSNNLFLSTSECHWLLNDDQSPSDDFMRQRCPFISWPIADSTLKIWAADLKTY